jgi:hypothetical protein
MEATEMATIWVWREYGAGPRRPQLPDISGYDVHAVDGKIGTVDEATNENGEGALVVDTGFWIFGTKRLLPAGIVQSIDEEERTITVSCTKEEVKNAPEYEAAKRDNADYRTQVGSHYVGDPIGPQAGPDLPSR